MMISNKKHVVLGITGSIAAYKAAELARLFVTSGYEVRAIMTESATKFISPLTIQAVTGNPVATSLWEEGVDNGIGHIQLADWADVLVIAPATADYIAKMAYGYAESSLLATVLATKAPLVIAPAMNVNMYENPLTQKNIETLRATGVNIVNPGVGALACGWNGSGRLADLEEILLETKKALTEKDLKGKKVLISAGPTKEAIDPVRYISNRSSGKMGVALAKEAYCRGATVTFVHGDLTCDVPAVFRSIPIISANELKDVILESADSADFVIMAAAVADFRPTATANQKIKKGTAPRQIELTKNDDILAMLGEKKGAKKTPQLIGFAVETGSEKELLEEMQRKLEIKNIDLVVGNFASEAFDKDTNRVFILDRNGNKQEIAKNSKDQIAKIIFDAVLR